MDPAAVMRTRGSYKQQNGHYQEILNDDQESRIIMILSDDLQARHLSP